jgi:hypothetical protein
VFHEVLVRKKSEKLTETYPKSGILIKTLEMRKLKRSLHRSTTVTSLQRFSHSNCFVIKPTLRYLFKAYEVLNDEEKRRIYDQYGEEGLKKNKGGGGAGWNPFADFFGFGRQGNSGIAHDWFIFGLYQESHLIDNFYFLAADSMRKGSDIGLPVFVTLEDLYLGKEIRVSTDLQFAIWFLLEIYWKIWIFVF